MAFAPTSSDPIPVIDDSEMTSGSDPQLLAQQSVASGLVPSLSVLHDYLIQVFTSGQPLSLCNLKRREGGKVTLPTTLPMDALAQSQAAKTLIKSVPQSVVSFYIDLLTAGLHHVAETPVPAKFAYTCPNEHYRTQLSAFGLLFLITEYPNSSTPLLLHPSVDAEAYHALTHMRCDENPHTLYKLLILRLLIPRLLTNPNFVIKDTDGSAGPKSYCQAASTGPRQQIKPKPKNVPQTAKLQPTPLPCPRCLTTALILTTTAKKYTHNLEGKSRGMSLDQFVAQLPATLRTQFRDTYAALTMGSPNHSEHPSSVFSSACSCSSCK